MNNLQTPGNYSEVKILKRDGIDYKKVGIVFYTAIIEGKAQVISVIKGQPMLVEGILKVEDIVEIYGTNDGAILKIIRKGDD